MTCVTPVKNTLTLCFFLASTIATAQAYVREEVVTVEATNASELYRRAERWFVNSFRDANEAIQLRDSSAHMLIAKGMGRAVYVTTGIAGISQDQWFTYSVEVECKESRYRARVYNATHTAGAPIMDEPCCYGDCSYSTAGKKMRERLQEAHYRTCDQIMGDLNAILPSLKAAMLSKEPNW